MHALVKLLGRRSLAVVAVSALTAGLVGFGATPASAGSQVTTNSCQNSATGTFTDLDISHTGAPTPNPATLGLDQLTLSGASVSAFFPAAVLIAGYNLGLLNVGVNDIPGTMDVTILASNTSEGSQTLAGIAISGQTTITDPDGTPGNGDESATDLSVTATIPSSTWTPTGGNVAFSDGGSITIASVFNGLIKVKFTCQPGTSTPAGCVTNQAVDCTGRAASPASPFDTVVVNSAPASTTTTSSTTTTTSSTTTSSTTTTAPPSSTTTTASPSTTTTSTTTPATTTTMAGPVSGTQVTTNSCQNTATGTFTDISFTHSGTTSTASGVVTLSGTTIAAEFPSAVLVAGYNLGLLTTGLNTIPGTMDVTILASNTSETSQTFPGIAISGETTITDPDGIPGNGDETATPLVVSINVPDSQWTPTGGDISFSDGGSVTTASVFNGLVKVSFKCQPGLSLPTGCVADSAVDCTDRSPVPALAFVSSAQGGTPVATTTSIPPSTTEAASTTTSESATTSTTEAPTSVGSGTSNFTATCTNNIRPSDTSTMKWTGRGTSLASFNAGDTVPLRNQRWNVTINGSTFDTGINLNLVAPGDRIDATAAVTINASNTVEGSKTSSGMPLSVVVEVNDDGTAKDATTSFFIPDTNWTASGGPIVWTPAGMTLTVVIPAIPTPLEFVCTPDPGTPAILDTASPQVLGESLAFTGTRGGGPLLPIAVSLILLDLGYMAWSATRPNRRRFL